MHTNPELTDLKLEQIIVKGLNKQDIDFAEKQYKKLYAEQMSKLSSKIEKIQRVKKHLQSIQSEQIKKQSEKKQHLNKKYELIQKTKQKHLNQKLKSYKLHQEFWESKISNIKRKKKQVLKANGEQLNKYKQQTLKFWKTKTQQIHQGSLEKSGDSRHYLHSLKRPEPKNFVSLKMHTEGTEFSRINHLKPTDRNYIFSKNKDNSKLLHNINETSHGKKDSNLSHKLSVHSLRDKKNQESRQLLQMPHLDQYKFSSALHSNQKNKTYYLQSSLKQINSEQNQKQSKLKMRNEQLNQKFNISFQKAMKKLDKIQKLKEKHTKRQKQVQLKILSPCKPRKSIDPEQYRLLRAKSQSKKPQKQSVNLNNNQNSQQQQISQMKHSMKQNKTFYINPRKSNVKSINESRLSIAQNKKRQEIQNNKVRDQILQNSVNKWKKDKIVKAIKDKICRIKLEEIQKIRQKSLY